MFLSTRVYFRMRATKRRPFLLPRVHAKGEPFLGDFFLLSLLYSRARFVLFFPGKHDQQNWNIKSALADDDDDATTRTTRARAYIYRKVQKALLSLTHTRTAPRKRLARDSFCSFFVILIRGVVVFYESGAVCSIILRKEETNIGYILSLSSSSLFCNLSSRGVERLLVVVVLFFLSTSLCGRQLLSKSVFLSLDQYPKST